MHEDVIRKHLSRIKRDNIANRARLTILELLPSGRVTGEDMARELNMSIRTLRRKLGEKDETVRSLLTNVRKDLAQRYIRNEDYNITEIAFLLGFADSSAFSRAFKNWFGQSPSEARKGIERTLN
jgi:AraC-like DNA-binding protein